MANKRLDYNKIYALIAECRKSGLSDRQWCLEHDISPSTFYCWIRRLRQKACFDIPEHLCSGTDNSIMPASKQDVVCVNIADSEPDIVEESYTTPAQTHLTDSIILQYGGANVILPEKFSDNSLSRVLRILKEEVC